MTRAPALVTRPLIRTTGNGRIMRLVVVVPLPSAAGAVGPGGGVGAVPPKSNAGALGGNPAGGGDGGGAAGGRPGAGGRGGGGGAGGGGAGGGGAGGGGAGPGLGGGGCAPAMILGVALDTAWSFASPLPRTTSWTRRRFCSSAGATTYELPLAPAMTEQLGRPLPGQLSHVHVGEPSSHCAVAVSVAPTWNTPLIVGLPLIFGLAMAGAADASRSAEAPSAATPCRHVPGRRPRLIYGSARRRVVGSRSPTPDSAGRRGERAPESRSSETK